ncbi:MAG: lysylphosphatidylglycerol synthase transmembrane domain-containing protein [Acidimicrobiales bacterium]
MGTDVAPDHGGQGDKASPQGALAERAGAERGGAEEAGAEETGAERAWRDAPPWWRLDLRLRIQTWRLLKRIFRRGVTAFLVALVIEYLVLPQIAGVNKDLHLLGQLNLGYALLGVALEVAALVSYASLTRSVLPKGSASLARLLRIQLSGVAVNHVIPGGTAAGTGIAYRLLTEGGVSGTDAGFGLATQGIGSALVLNVILWLALIVSIGVQGFNAIYVTAALVGVVLFSGFGALVFALTRGAERSATILAALARRLPFLKEETVTTLVTRLAVRLRELGADRQLLRRAVAWAAANWLFDAASLWVFLLAFHHAVGPDALLVAYGLANVLAAIPITPGGLGIVEGVLIPSLVGFGTPRGIAILAVISYRLVNFWLPIPVGALAYLSLHLEPGSSRARAARELRSLLARRSS